MTHTRKILTGLCALIALTGCSGAKEKLGLTKHVPDEFAVVKRAPLAMPPDYTLRPPRPGSPRPQEASTIAEARSAVLGTEPAPIEGITKGEALFLEQAGAGRVDPAVRQKIDAETPVYAEKSKPVVQRIMGTGDPEGASSVVNATKESERLKKNKEEGKAVTSGETPSVEE